jgi:hypothetical protein
MNCQTGQAETPSPIVTPSKFGEKFKNLHRTIVITKPGVYDYEKTMHIWQGGGYCSILGASYPVMEIHADNVTIKNFGFKEAKSGIVVFDKEDGSPRENVTLENIEGRACHESLRIPGRSTNLRILDSIFLVE